MYIGLVVFLFGEQATPADVLRLYRWEATGDYLRVRDGRLEERKQATGP